MKFNIKILSLAALIGVAPALVAQAERKVVVTTFTPEVRTKVVRYFEPFAEGRYGLPPEIVTKVKVERMPTVWKTARIKPGAVIEKEYRPLLVSAPPQLVEVLPEPEKHKYYLAGSNVVVIDDDYRIIDSLHVPSVTFVTKEE
jgi:hypothetical protein